MTERSIIVRLRAEIDDFKRKMGEASTAADKLGQHALKNQESWQTAGMALTAFGVATVAALGLSARAAMNWESAWTGVLKTVDGTAEQLERLEGDLRQMALDMPASTTEIAAVAEAAGQLGVGIDDVAAFTKVMIDLGNTTNLSADEAATAIAQLMNVMQTAPEDVDRLGAALVALGNNGASTERDIILMAQRIAGAAKIVGLTEAQVLGLANALASVGIDAEAGGTAISKVMIDIAQAVDEGGAKLDLFAETAGMTAAEFTRAFKDDPGGAIASFVEGLGRINAAGGSVFTTLDQLGQVDARTVRALLSTANAGDLLRNSLEMGTAAWEENNALVAEAQKRYATAESKIQMARNAISDAAITLGQMLLPILAWTADRVADLAEWFGNLPAPIQAIIAAGGGLVGILALLGGGFLLVFPRIMQVQAGLASLATTAPAASAALSRMGTVTKFATIGFGGLLGVVGLVSAAMSLFGGSNAEAEARVDSLTESLDKQTGAITDATRALVVQRLEESGALEVAQELGLSLDVVTEAALGSADAIEQIKAAIDEGGLGNRTVLPLVATVGSLNTELDASADSWVRVTEASGETAAAQADAAAAIESTTQAFDKWLATVGDADASFIDLQGAYDNVIASNQAFAQSTADATESADDSWETFYDGVSVSADDYIAQLQAQVDAQANWETNVVALTQRARDGMAGAMTEAANAMIDELIQLGPEGAAQVALLASMTDAEFAQVVTLWGQQGTAAVEEFTAQVESYRQPVITPTIDLGPVYGKLTALANGSYRTSTGALLYADGGPIVGPGGPRSDSVLVAASNGEYMVDAYTVGRAGGFAGMASWVRSVRGYANGGGIGVSASSSGSPGYGPNVVKHYHFYEASSPAKMAVEIARREQLLGA